MKNTLKIEELAMLLLGTFLFYELDYTWWWFLVLFLLPDIGMLGYLVNTRVGAFSYNLFHHKGIALLVYFSGVFSDNRPLMLAGVILFSHAAFDRLLGYGLKYTDSFHHTHLGKAGRP